MLISNKFVESEFHKISQIEDKTKRLYRALNSFSSHYRGIQSCFTTITYTIKSIFEPESEFYQGIKNLNKELAVLQYEMKRSFKDFTEMKKQVDEISTYTSYLKVTTLSQ